MSHTGLGIIIQARMGSERFPGKSLHAIQGRPSIGHLLDSLKRSFQPEIIHVASPRSPENDALAEFARKEGVHVHRGSETNVAERFAEIVSSCKYKRFVRISADSPLLDHRIVTRLIETFSLRESQIASTAHEEGFPSGMNAEVLDSQVFLSAYPEFSAEAHFEHVTRFFYERPERYRMTFLPSSAHWAKKFKFSFDTQDDLARIEKIFGTMARPHYEYDFMEKCSLYRRLFAGGSE